MRRLSETEDAELIRTLGLRAPGGRPGLRRWRWWAGLALLGAAGALAWAMRDGGEAPRYRTEEVRRGDLVVSVSATGTLQPINQVEVGSELSGSVRSVAVDFNEGVTVGQVLARLDTSKLEAQEKQSLAGLEAARAKVLQARATVREARSQLARLRAVRRLSRQEVPSQQDLEAAEASVDRAQADEASAQAAVLQAQAALEANRTELAKAVIRSPINGVVLSRTVEPGQTVAASLQAPVLFTLAEDLTQMELHVDVDEADVGQVQAGQAATFTVDAYPNRAFPAAITQVRYGPKTVGGVVTYETLLKVDNGEQSLRPGMTATATIEVRRLHDALLVPNAALRFEPALPAEEPGGSRGLVGMLLPHPPRAWTRPRGPATPANGSKRVWVLRDGQPAAVRLTSGATDGTLTEVTGGEVQAGMVLLVDSLAPPR